MNAFQHAELYDSHHDFVAKYGEDVVALLRPVAGEKILDLGCGTGDLAGEIARSGARVTGIDVSPEMIRLAREKFPQVSFCVASATDFELAERFDAVFSNATLHWITTPETAIERMFHHLKPGGRFVAEFGGKGNVASIETALKEALRAEGYAGQAGRKVWYFPSPAEYAALLEKGGFVVRMLAYFDRPTPLQGEEGIRNWLRMFGSPFLNDVPDSARVMARTEEILRPAAFRNGVWYLDYRRLRVVAERPA